MAEPVTKLPPRVRVLCALSTLCLGIAFAACGGDDGRAATRDAGPAEGTFARFDLAADPMPFGAIPWPDDLYLGPDGRIDLGELPGERDAFVPEYIEALRTTLRDLDGFGTVSPVFFTFDGELEPASLPETPSASMRADASVFLVDVDSASPDAFVRVPVWASFEPSTKQLALRPDDGHPLAPGRRYAAVLTRRVRGSDGEAVLPDPGFAAIRDATTRPTDSLFAEAHDQYSPVLSSLETQGVPREDVVALAVFRVQTIATDLADARTRIWERDPPVIAVDEVVAGAAALDERLGTPIEDLPGLDVEGGVQHSAIGFMIHGSYESPWLVSDTEHVHGRFRRDREGRLRIGRTEAVPFTLFLSRSADLAALRVVVFQHGLGGERSDALAVADSLAAAGYSVLAIDAPFHGLRSPRASPDDSNRFTAEASPDGFGDRRGGLVVADFAGIEDARGELESFHPVYLRDALRQAVVDLLALVRALRTRSSWDAVRDAHAELAGLAFAESPLAFIGYSLGGMIGTMFTAMEPDVGASVLAVTGGYFMNLLVESPPYNAGYVPLFFPLLGVDPAAVDYQAYHPVVRPEIAIVQTLFDRGDPINYGKTIRGRSVDVLMFMAKHDETLNNVATESLARAIGAEMVAAEPAHTDISVATAPVRDNAMVEGDVVTRALYVHAPATHGLMVQRSDVSRYAHPVEAPFEEVAETAVDNPIDDAIGQTLHFFESWRSGAAEVAAPPPG